MFFLSMGLVVAFLVQVIITSQNMELKRPFRKIFGNFLPKDLIDTPPLSPPLS